MKKKANITRRENIDISEYVNINTGETLTSLLPKGGRLQILDNSDLFTIKSKDYITIEGDAIVYICKMLSSGDCTKLTMMAQMLKTQFNIVFNNTVPHNLDTLSAALGISKDETTRVIKRLVKAGIAAYTVCAPSGYIEKIYMINPAICRKRNTFNKELLLFFKDFTFIDPE